MKNFYIKILISTEEKFEPNFYSDSEKNSAITRKLHSVFYFIFVSGEKSLSTLSTLSNLLHRVYQVRTLTTHVLITAESALLLLMTVIKFEVVVFFYKLQKLTLKSDIFSRLVTMLNKLIAQLRKMSDYPTLRTLAQKLIDIN